MEKDKLFKYNDGESDVYGDPSEIDFQIDHLDVQGILFPDRLAMLPLKDDGSIDFDKADPLDIKLAADASHDAESLIRQAFQLKPFDRTTGNGLTYEEVLRLYARYIDWRDSIKKDMPGQPGSAVGTA